MLLIVVLAALNFLAKRVAVIMAVELLVDKLKTNSCSTIKNVQLVYNVWGLNGIVIVMLFVSVSDCISFIFFFHLNLSLQKILRTGYEID